MKTRYIILLSAAAAATAASAQDLVKEIDVDRTIVPVERAVSRPDGPSAAIFTPAVKPVELSAADRYTPSVLTALATAPAPALWGSTQPLTPYRGYVSGGYLPVYNLGLTAGYQFISDPASQFGAWGMYTGDSYKYSGDKYNNHFLGLGARGSHIFGNGAALRADLTYRHDSFTTPYVDDNKQSASIVDFHSAYTGNSTLALYTVAADVLHFSFGDALTSVSGVHGDAMRQTQVKVGGGATFNIPDLTVLRPGADVSFDVLMSNNSPKVTALGLATGDVTYGIVRFDPYALIKAGEFEGRVGVNFSFGVCDYSTIRVSPGLRLAYNPAHLPVNVWATIEGGMEQNRIYDLYERDYTCTPPFALKPYNIPVAFRVGINVSPLANFRAGVRFGYAVTRDMAVPWYNVDVVPGMTTERKLDGMNFGIDLSYTHPLFTARAGYEAATSSKTDPAKGWYLWRDRANSSVTAAVDVRPLDRLTVTVSYLGRYGRHTFAPTTDTSLPWVKISTRDISSLNLGARYEFSPSLSFFANVENILNHRYCFSSGVPAQGVTGLLGAQYKF